MGSKVSKTLELSTLEEIQMKPFAVITNGSYFNKPVNGSFELVQPYKDYSPSEVTGGYAKEGFTGYIRVVIDGKPRYVHTNGAPAVSECGVVQTTVDEQIPEEVDLEALDLKIRRRFEVMDILCSGVQECSINSLIISGAPGIGKTYTFEKELTLAHEEGRIGNFEHVKGKVTPLYLFKLLYENKNEGDVILLDDCDAVFDDETSLNILKAALDTSNERWLTYGSSTRWLEDNGIENTFKYEGTIVFITNYNFDKMIASNNKFAPHFSALISRTTYLDLAIHSRLEVMVRIQQIATGGSLMKTMGVNETTSKEMVEWCWENYQNMRELSIRSLIKMARYAHVGDWKMLCEELFLA